MDDFDYLPRTPLASRLNRRFHSLSQLVKKALVGLVIIIVFLLISAAGVTIFVTRYYKRQNIAESTSAWVSTDKPDSSTGYLSGLSSSHAFPHLSTTTAMASPLSFCNASIIPTYKKTGTIVAGGIEGTSLDEMKAPFGIALDSKSNLYACDWNNNRIMKYAPGVRSGLVLMNGTSVGISYPTRIFINPANNDLYFVDLGWDGTYAYRVRHASADQQYTSARVLFQRKGKQCLGFYLDTDLNIYTTETYIHQVLKWLAPSYQTYEIVAGAATAGTASNELNNPQDIYIDARNNDLYISDSRNQRIQKWSPNATTGVTVVYLPSGSPGVMCIDCHGNYFVLDVIERNVKWFASLQTSGLNGIVLFGGIKDYTYMHPDNRPTDYLGEPLCITLDLKNGDVYVSDMLNNRVLKFEIDDFADRS